MTTEPQDPEFGSLVLSPGTEPRRLRGGGRDYLVPASWGFLPPGDATLTRRIKAAGPSWTVKEQVGRRVQSRGIWAPAATIAAQRVQLEAERATEGYQVKLARSRERSAKKQEVYVEDFVAAVRGFLRFAPAKAHLAEVMAQAVAAHATPVGSGTVARTARIPIEERAEAAVIAWMRHQTTAYDDMRIPRVRGKRREIRRLLAARSHQLLDAYRVGPGPDLATCPLRRALGL